ncbi:predicted protein [Naegleria gruberi]|uniref:Fucosyltransferase n=1 Tax=Naegleria gruberi TaxID=5762 RepID=D2VYB5_NAEGR|nr:uncharacterized protein NAEGRDRAFT_74059 [Naegleria gruberi]EFC38173.1 predicted protein [Naegleria gruberi]|eukprot:XP_002670917.1 predicted protein [Naegleria gruberi strain NEG-M]
MNLQSFSLSPTPKLRFLTKAAVIVFVMVAFLLWRTKKDRFSNNILIKEDETNQAKQTIEQQVAKLTTEQKLKKQAQHSDDTKIYHQIADLLTRPSGVGSYDWYKQQLEKYNSIGNTTFKDSYVSRIGFKNEEITSPNWFHYFRTYKVKEVCSKQHSCEILPFSSAQSELSRGVKLDAIIYHDKYSEGILVSGPKDIPEQVSVKKFQETIKSYGFLNSVEEISNKIDSELGETLWRMLRRLTFYMNGESVVRNIISGYLQTKDDPASMERFSSTSIDVSVCFFRSCTLFNNYLYYPINLLSPKFAKNTQTKPGLCAFISNCVAESHATQRLQILEQLSTYLPVRQYGKCGRNAYETNGGKMFELEHNCKIYFAMENSVVPDYITEKLYEGFKSMENGGRLLMVYKGPPNIADFKYPKSAFINVDDFSSIDELGQYLKKLNENEDEFNKRFAELERDRVQINHAIKMMRPSLSNFIPCRMCKIVGQTKLARYLLFKIGLQVQKKKLNYREWDEFKKQFDYIGPERMAILDSIYLRAYANQFHSENINTDINDDEVWK